MSTAKNTLFYGAVPGIVFASWQLVRRWLELVEQKNIPYTIPGPADAIAYAVTEVGEVVDAILRAQRPQDTRANDRETSIRDEICDVFIMLAHAISDWKPETYSISGMSLSPLSQSELEARIALLNLHIAKSFMLEKHLFPAGRESTEATVAALATCYDAFEATRDGEDFNGRRFYEDIFQRLAYRTRKVVQRKRKLGYGEPKIDEELITELLNFFTFGPPSLQPITVSGLSSAS